MPFNVMVLLDPGGEFLVPGWSTFSDIVGYAEAHHLARAERRFAITASLLENTARARPF
jgi:hypothetical protein